MINPKNVRDYLENFLKIRTKDGRETLLRLKPAQEKLYEQVRKTVQAGKPVRKIILKARQLGFSTEVAGIIFQSCATQPNRTGFFAAHTADATDNLHKMHKRFLDGLPPQLKPMVKASNGKEILFENPSKDPEERRRSPGLKSRIRCATAGGKGIGRSDTIQYLHVSEYAFWPDGKAMGKQDTLLGLLQAVPSIPGTMVFIESTANGYDDFERLWEMAVRGESEFEPVFFPWYEEPGYRRPVEPGTVWTPEEKKMQERFRLDEEQLSWRRWCIRNNCGGDINKFHQEYPATPEEAFLATGECWFDTTIVRDRLNELRDAKPKSRRGEFRYDVVWDQSLETSTLANIRFVESENGSIELFLEPEAGLPYVLGGDTAGEGSDWFSGFVFRNTDAAMCAVLHRQYDEITYTRQMYCLGRYYNWALLGIEANFSTYPINTLQQMHYPRQYVRRVEDAYTHKVTEKYGWRTDSVTRPAMLAELKTVFEAHPEKFCSIALLQEMLVFVKDENGRPAALSGEHDDLVMGCAVSLRIRQQQSAKDKRPRKKWTRDMLEDYRAATPEQKRLLRSKWGDPT